MLPARRREKQLAPRNSCTCGCELPLLWNAARARMPKTMHCSGEREGPRSGACAAWQQASYELWRNPRPSIRWMGKALAFDIAQSATWFALAGCAPMQIGRNRVIGVPIPAPDPFDPDDYPTGDVVLVDPVLQRGTLLGRWADDLVCPSPQPRMLKVHLNAVIWLREWVEDRAAFFRTRRFLDSGALRHFRADPPSALIIGKVRKIRWCTVHARTLLVDDDDLRRTVEQALLQSARLPDVVTK